MAVAALQFYEPVLFGKVVDLLATAKDKSADVLWREVRELLMVWVVVGVGGLVANIVVSLQADRMAHRRRLGAMARFLEHVLALPFAFHSAQHSGQVPSRTRAPIAPGNGDRSNPVFVPPHFRHLISAIAPDPGPGS